MKHLTLLCDRLALIETFSGLLMDLAAADEGDAVELNLADRLSVHFVVIDDSSESEVFSDD